MSAPLNPSVEGPSHVELELRLPNSKIIPLDKINIVHVTSTIKESLFSSSEHVFTIKSPTMDFVDNLLRYAFAEGTPKLRYRLGIGVPGNTFYLPWQEHIITSYGASLEGIGLSTGHYTQITTNDHLFTMSRVNKVATRRGKISDIVATMAQQQGLTHTVIEPTQGEALYIQSYMDDVDFIRQRLIPRAVNAKGRGNYHLCLQDNVLHFHSPDYQATIKELLYYQGSSMSLTQLDHSEHHLEMGASGASVIGYDPYTGEIKEVPSDPTQALRLGNTTHNLFRLKGTQANILYHLSANPPQEIDFMAQNTYEAAHSMMLGLNLEMTQTLFLRVGDILKILISPSNQKNSIWSGTYLVTSSVHDLDRGALKSSFVVRRGEFQTAHSTPSSFYFDRQNVVRDEITAPGQDLNVKETQSSSLTKGAGKSVGASVFVTAIDPSKG